MSVALPYNVCAHKRKTSEKSTAQIQNSVDVID